MHRLASSGSSGSSLPRAPTFARSSCAVTTSSTFHAQWRVCSFVVAAATAEQDDPAAPQLTLSKPEVRHQGPLTNKQIKDIKSTANGLAANKRLLRVTMGKKGVTDNFIVDCMRALRAHQVIRVSVADGADLDREDASELLTSLLDCVCVQAIGSSLTLYRDINLPMPSNIVDVAAENAGQKARNLKRA
jgi:RNA-binding protein YhbY